jgi:hypothetical protein
VIGYNADCLADNLELCPLSLASLLSAIPSIANPFMFEGKNVAGISMSYRKIIELCVNNEQPCGVNVVKTNDRYTKIGSIEIDITKPDYFKILKIETEPQSSCLLKIFKR